MSQLFPNPKRNADRSASSSISKNDGAGVESYYPAFGTNAATIFFCNARSDMSVEHFVNARRRRLRILRGKVIIGFNWRMDWDER